MLHDRIVCGISNTQIQKRLLAEKTLTFAKAMELAQRLEAAAKNAKELSQVRSQEALPSNRRVYAVMPPASRKESVGTRKPNRGYCYCCGQMGHSHSECYFRKAEYYGCAKTGYLQQVSSKTWLLEITR